MGEKKKRGSYRGYNKQRYEKTYASTKSGYRTPNEVTAGAKIASGKAMFKAERFEKFKHFIGEQIIIHRQIQSNEKERTVGGCVVGIYPHFLLLDCGNYKTTISYKDLLLGGRR